jgi:hypothetical protein
MANFPPMPFVVGCGRSGTTLLRLMLDAHPALAIPPETGFFAGAAELSSCRGSGLCEAFFEQLTHYPPQAPAWNDFGIDQEVFRSTLARIEPFTLAEGYRAFYRLYAHAKGKPRCGDKTPLHCLYMRGIANLLPEAHFIHLIRDGRDVALSLRQTWFSPGDDIETQAAHWQQWVVSGREQGKQCPHYLEVHYENLVRDPRTILRRICQFIDLRFDSCMLDYHRNALQRLGEHGDRYDVDGRLVVSQPRRLVNQRKTTEPPDVTRAYAWKSVMAASEVQRFENIAGNALREFGYA